MTWVKIDDAAPLHPKIMRCGPAAAWLWVCGMAFCNRVHTDGIIPKDALHALHTHRREWSDRVLARLAGELVGVGLWHDEGPHYRVHDYADYQEEALRDSVAARRIAARERKRKQRDRDKIGTSRAGHAVTHRDGHTDGHKTASRAESSDVSGRPPASAMSQGPVPSRPVPSERETHALALGTPTERWTAWSLWRSEASKAADRPIHGPDLEAAWTAIVGEIAARLRLTPEDAFEAICRTYLSWADDKPLPDGKVPPRGDRPASWLRSGCYQIEKHLAGTSNGSSKATVREEAARRRALEAAAAEARQRS